MVHQIRTPVLGILLLEISIFGPLGHRKRPKFSECHFLQMSKLQAQVETLVETKGEILKPLRSEESSRTFLNIAPSISLDGVNEPVYRASRVATPGPAARSVSTKPLFGGADAVSWPRKGGAERTADDK
jgi:hypothetical protein